MSSLRGRVMKIKILSQYFNAPLLNLKISRLERDLKSAKQANVLLKKKLSYLQTTVIAQWIGKGV